VTSDEAKGIIRAHVADEINTRKPEVAAQRYTADAINHAVRVGSPQVGRVGFERTFANIFTAFPDWHFTIEDIVAEGDTVWCRLTLRGTHLGVLNHPALGRLLVGVPPTGKRVEVQHIHIFRLQGHEISEHRAVRDDLEMMRQLGLLPSSSHPAGDISRPAS
jgi:C-1 hydroxylase